MCSSWQIKPDILSAVLLFNHAVILLATQILSGNKVAPPSLLVILIQIIVKRSAQISASIGIMFSIKVYQDHSNNARGRPGYITQYSGLVLVFLCYFIFHVCVYLNSYCIKLSSSISRIVVLPKENKALQLMLSCLTQQVKAVSGLFLCSCAAVLAVFIPASSAGDPIQSFYTGRCHHTCNRKPIVFCWN